MLKMYEVPDDRQPKNNKLIKFKSKLNSVVNGESMPKNQPT